MKGDENKGRARGRRRSIKKRANGRNLAVAGMSDSFRSQEILTDPQKEKASPSLPSRSNGSATLLFEKVLRQMKDPAAAQFLRTRDVAWLLRVISQMASQFTRRFAFDYQRASLQKRLLDEISGGDPGHRIWRDFEKAKRARVKRILDLSCLMLTGKGFAAFVRQSNTIAKARIAPAGIAGPPKPSAVALPTREDVILRLARMGGDEVMKSEWFRQLANREFAAGRGTSLMDRLDRHKRRNQKGFGISPHQLVIAQNWTNPDLPLWLCHHGKKALPAILQKIFGLEQLTPDSLKKERDRNLSLACCYPICEISSASDGGYELILRVGSKRWREKCLA